MTTIVEDLTKLAAERSAKELERVLDLAETPSDAGSILAGYFISMFPEIISLMSKVYTADTGKPVTEKSVANAMIVRLISKYNPALKPSSATSRRSTTTAC